MAAEFIETICLGQRALGERNMLELAQQKGLLSSEGLSRLQLDADFSINSLVDEGVLSREQVLTLADEAMFSDMVSTFNSADVPDVVQQARTNANRRIGRYVLVAEIGAGGMGVVWRGWDMQLSRWVAIKQLKVNDANLVNRFIREASLLAQLSHPNVTSVYEIGVHHGMPYLVMQLIEGGPPKLGEYTHRQAAEIVMHAAHGVAHAHDHGMIHRDLKPSNLLVDGSGRVFVTDFGLARMQESQNDLTASGTLLGTPAYMASEQAQGREADERTDVYGLGACLYALIAGEAPFTGDAVHELVKRVALSNPPVLDGNNDLKVIVQKAMERDREDRYATAGELAAELRRYLDDEPILARPLNPLQRSLRRARRNPRKTLTYAFVFTLVLVALSWSSTRLYQNYERQNQIDAASVFIANAKGQEDQLNTLSSFGQIDAELEKNILGRLRDAAQQALAQAPGYAEGEFYLGRAAMLEGDFVTAQQHFDAALLDDPFHEMARVQRMVTVAILDDVASPEIVQDRNGFRIQPARDTSAKREMLERMRQELALVHPDSQQMNLLNALLLNMQGDFAAAVAALDLHLLDFPIDNNIRSLLLLALIAEEDFDRVNQLSAELIEKGVFVPDAYAAQAYVAAGQESYATAISLMQQAIDAGGGVDYKSWIATWQLEEGLLDASIETYISMLNETPEHVGALLGRAMLLGRIFEPGAPEMAVALVDARRAVELQPENAYAHFVLGQSALVQEDETAVAAYEQAIRLDPEEYAAYGGAMLSTVRYRQGDLTEAIAHLTQALGREPDKANWRLMLARYLHLDSQYEKSLEQLAPYVDAGIEEAMYLATQNHIHLNNYVAVLELGTKLVQLDPKEASYAFAQVRGLAGIGQRAQAEEALRRVAQIYLEDTSLQQDVQALAKDLGLSL